MSALRSVNYPTKLSSGAYSPKLVEGRFSEVLDLSQPCTCKIPVVRRRAAGVLNDVLLEHLSYRSLLPRRKRIARL
jgi:hypothetical protein